MLHEMDMTSGYHNLGHNIRQIRKVRETGDISIMENSNRNGD